MVTQWLSNGFDRTPNGLFPFGSAPCAIIIVRTVSAGERSLYTYLFMQYRGLWGGVMGPDELSNRLVVQNVVGKSRL